jgi:hypothetical protein
MYQNVAPATAAAASSALPFTGLNIIWVLLAAFTLLAASGALWRIFPKKEG